MREAAAKAIAIPIAGQPDARAVAGIQRLAPTAAPAKPAAFQENRFDVAEFILLSASDGTERRGRPSVSALVTDAARQRSLQRMVERSRSAAATDAAPERRREATSEIWTAFCHCRL